MPPKSSSRSNDRSEHGDEAEEFKLPENKLLQRAVSIHGLLEIIQIVRLLFIIYRTTKEFRLHFTFWLEIGLFISTTLS